ncbi:AfsR/SARP family transcriptional regulator [Amycolatopsis sp. Hca4]|uniref:AfsR/SARP family transcriptional regulator n=1 Tax=unclassified Amycolatopsis TaxID=2618356 RepID=UPI001592063C|nr:AfsR/SARP family transcriptional regulator [Amycolatopsis sp. Hca4]QKV74640.1 AfsR/SARP family transcriptional regulator [Amycolatopsis sp. Hca4]
MGDRTTITILGNLSIRGRHRTEAAPSAPKEREVLALLLFNYARVVPVHQLIDELWPSEPPRRARTALQTYILNLRRRLADGLRLPPAHVRNEVLVTRSEGYRFQLEDSVFDLHEYLNLSAAGERAAAAGDDVPAVDLLRRAEKLWTGPVLPDIDLGLPLKSEITRLEQRRVAARELRIESELRLGRHRELVSELSMLVHQHPYHERFHEYLMFSLHRVDRRVEALEVFERLRHALTSELGLQPSERVQNLRRGILASDEVALALT